MSAASRAPLPTVGQRLGSYEVLSELAQGGMAVVYLARKHSQLGFRNLFAIKVLLPHLRERELVEMFLDEARVAVAIRSPNVVRVVELGESDGVSYIVMEYLRGHSLDAVMRHAYAKHEAVPYGLVCAILQQTAAGLHAAHSDGVIHRDVKPLNIHVGSDGCVKLVDFGIASSHGSGTAARPGVVRGTLHYLAPEQITRSPSLDHRADLWSLGVVAWEALTGRYLFRGDDAASTLWNVLHKEVPDVRTSVPALPDEVAAQIMACLSRDPLHRPADARVVEDAFRAGAAAAGVTTTLQLSQAIATLGTEAGGLVVPVARPGARTSLMTRRFAGRPSTRPETTSQRARLRRRWIAAAAVLGGIAVALAGFVATLA